MCVCVCMSGASCRIRDLAGKKRVGSRGKGENVKRKKKNVQDKKQNKATTSAAAQEANDKATRRASNVGTVLHS